MEVSGRRTDFTEEGTADQLDKFCELCEADHVTTIANGICRECDEYMCSTCFRTHLKAKLCRHHVLIYINDIVVRNKAENVEKCRSHATETIKYYCRKHETVGCGDCMIPVHGACKPENIKDLSKQFHNNKGFERLVAKLQDFTKANNEHDKKVQENKKANDIMLEKALKEIKCFRKEINNYLDIAETRITTEAEDIGRKNGILLAKLQQECIQVASKITEVKHKLDTGLYQDSALFIQTVDCKPSIFDIERAVTRIQTENDIRTFEFIPDEQLQDIITSIEKLGSMTKPVSKLSAKSGTIRDTTPERRKTHEKHMVTDRKAQKSANRVAVGARVLPFGICSGCDLAYHEDEPGTVTAVNSDGTVDVEWDASGWTRNYKMGVDVEFM